ncbi:hypothetical protein BB559_006702 [Furculomyces boomerangus]|uniref:THUMP domain-containing protein n=1 Tax=Furculomyces boomerangus TaxID=61424 RepID=A0A2T9Y134_9FUNG|nr:hypothetical protein BB559_006702 [Furculomyces boomerangus]
MSNKRVNDSVPSDRQKKKSYFKSKAIQAGMGLVVGMTGFYITSEKGRERKSVKEVISLLSKNVEKMYPEQSIYADQKETDQKETVKDETAKDEKKEKKTLDSIEDMVKAELEEMKKPKRRSIFEPIYTSMACVSFISCPKSINVVDLIKKIMVDTATERKKDTRYTSRIVPIQTTCPANLSSISESVKAIGSPLVDFPNSTFMVVAKIRNNGNITKEEITTSLGTMFSSHKVDLNNPDFSIIVEVFRGNCIISILPDYMKLRKYNVTSLFSDGFAQPKPSVNEKTE